MAPPAAGAKDQSFGKLPVAAKLGLLVVLLGLVSAVYYFALHMPLTDDIAAKNAETQTLNTSLTDARRRHQEYLTLRSELESREGMDRGNYRVLPERAEIASFLENLNRQAELSGLRMRTVEPTPEEAEEMYVRIPVNLALTGRYHQLARFFYNVSKLERAISMENIQLTQPRLEGDDTVLTVSVLATTFRRPTAPAGGAAPGAAPAPAPVPAGGH